MCGASTGRTRFTLTRFCSTVGSQSFRPATPNDLAAVVDRCLRPLATDRYRDVSERLADLHRPPPTSTERHRRDDREPPDDRATVRQTLA